MTTVEAPLSKNPAFPYFRPPFLATFLKKTLRKSFDKVKEIVRVAALLIMGLLMKINPGMAQDWGGGWGTTDTSVSDSTVTASSGWGTGEESSPSKPAPPPYVRFMPPFDTLRELVFYEGIIEDEECMTCGTDSLYLRARKYFLNKLGKENFKKYVIEDKKNERLVLRIVIPMMVVNNDFNKQEVGQLEYKVTLRFKDGRYKYQFGNFVHIQTAPGPEGKTTRTYHEYYYKAKRGFKITDKYLMAADREVKSVVAELTKNLREPYQPDEDDW